MTNEVTLRATTEADLPIFFEQQLEKAANHMAAFTTADPTDRAAFDARWARIRNDERIMARTILFRGGGSRAR